MQKTYISTLYKFMKQDKNVISCLSDSGTDYDEIIARELPLKVLNYGISENNKVASASGLASCGKIPFVYTTNAFLAYRSYEFVRDDVCLQNRNVKIVGMGCGISWSTLGPTHHTVYIRIGMGNEEEIYQDECKFTLGKNVTISEGKDAVIFTTGSIISEVLKAKEKLKEENIDLKVINVPTIKPFDISSVINEGNNYKKIISVEEHNVIGGLGSSIADVIATNNLNTKLYKIGINDTFAKGYGTYQEMKEMNNLDSESIYKELKKILSN